MLPYLKKSIAGRKGAQSCDLLCKRAQFPLSLPDAALMIVGNARCKLS